MAFEVGTRVRTHAGSTTRAPRVGTIEEVLRGEPAPRYRVRWDDGRETRLHPGERDAAGAAGPPPRRKALMRVVALEEHCVTPALREVLGEQIHPYYPVHRWPEALEARLSDLGDGPDRRDGRGGCVRAGPLDRAAGTRARRGGARDPRARSFNDAVAEAIAAHPDRFAGFAALPTADPGAAAAELERAVRELGMVGAMVNGRTLERFLDDEFFWPIFEAAEALDVPIYLHPMPPPKAVYDLYYAGFGDDVGFMLGAGAWGWHVETGLHALRLILAGRVRPLPGAAGDRRAHGRGAPVHGRARERRARRRQRARPRRDADGTPGRRPTSTRNFHITTSGFFTNPTLRCALDVIGEDRVMFSVDHPFSRQPRRDALARGGADRRRGPGEGRARQCRPAPEAARAAPADGRDDVSFLTQG